MPPAALQRARGRAVVALAPAVAGPRPRIAALEQSGAAKLFLPRVHGDRPELVFLNTAGGLTDGDRLDYAITLAPGQRALAATQTAERAYRARPGGAPARMEVRLQLGPGAVLDWLPQETILYQGAALSRHTRADIAQDARLLMAEMVVLGRQAMGEEVTALAFRDRREIWRDGQPFWIDPFELSSADLAGSAARPALTGGATALATVALVGEDAEDIAAGLARRLQDASGTGSSAGISAGVSGWDGRCLLRLAGREPRMVKRLLAELLPQLSGAGHLPRVWQV